MLASLRRPNTYTPLVFLLPAIVILTVGLLVPLWRAFELSFHDWSMGLPWESREYIGTQAYERMLHDDGVRESLTVTLKYSFWIIVLEMIIGVGLALLLEKSVRGIAVFRTIFILPLMVSPVVVGLIWRYLFDARSGFINYYLQEIGDAIPFLERLGFKTQLWLADPDLALGSLIVTDIWQWTPFILIIVLAGLQALPAEITEAAYIDGANWWQMTLRVKLPMLRSILLVTLLMRLIDVFRALEVIFVMTFGGPGRSTEVLSLHIYKTAFTSMDLGYASTISMLLIGILFVLSLAVLLYSNPLKERAEF